MGPLLETILFLLIIVQLCLLLVLLLVLVLYIVQLLARTGSFFTDIFTTAHTRRGSEQVLRDPVQETCPPLLQENPVQEARGVLDVHVESLYQKNLSASLVTGSKREVSHIFFTHLKLIIN